MKKLNVVLLVFVINFLMSCSQSTETEQSIVNTDVQQDEVNQPNVIFILVDDMGFGDVGYNGSDIATPNLDQMANAGMTLNRNYVYPICSPTRAGLLTGHNPLHYGIDGPIPVETGMPVDLKLMPEYFNEMGYQSFMVGKWHLGLKNTDFWPASRGFQSHYGFLAGSVDYYTHVYQGGLDWQRDGVSLREEGHATDLLTAEAKRVLETRDRDNPFFLYLAYNAPHGPIQTPPQISGLNEGIAPGNRYVYAEMVTQVDDGIGQVINELENQGILENTIVIFSSDNGGSLALGSNNGDLRGAKASPWEGGMRVPGLIMWADHIAAGQVLEQQIAIHDWLPTLLEAVGSDSSRAVDPYGQSMWSAIDRGVEVDRLQSVMGSGDHSRAVFDWPWKLVRDGVDGEHQLYNVVEDPNEQENLAQAQPEILANLGTVLAAMPNVSLRQGVSEPDPEPAARGGGAMGMGDMGGDEPRQQRQPRGVNIDYESRAQETRPPWAEAAERGSN